MPYSNPSIRLNTHGPLFRRLLWVSILLFYCAAGSAQQNQELVLEVAPTMERLLQIADTDRDRKITVDDDPGTFILSDSVSNIKLEETYHLSNLLQELAAAKERGKKVLRVSLSTIKEAPAERISRRIKEVFWNDLTRTIDRQGIRLILEDQKAAGEVERLYVPAQDTVGIRYYKELEKEMPGLEVVILPNEITPEYVKSLNDSPGLLALDLQEGQGVPFVVPGGRFNEMYGWDSYFEGVGLLLDGRVDLAKAMVDNFIYQIRYYGKILNANRSYYLTRSQPPFFSSFVREVYQEMPEKNIQWLRKALEAAINEYEQVWMKEGERLTWTGLNRYYAQGIGIPPETEEGHFDSILSHYAAKHRMSRKGFVEQYQSGALQDTTLDRYFQHDRSMRESGHDTSWRLEGKAADLVPVGLNSLLYKYEKDFEYLIKTYFQGNFQTSTRQYSAQYWSRKAERRLRLMNHYLWDEQKGSFFDFHLKDSARTDYMSATNFYPLWAQLATKEQADRMTRKLLKHLKAPGGILASSRLSVEKNRKNEMQRQWDYPFGWAPHQMLLWRGLLQYEHNEVAHELVYRWLYMISRNAADYNGTIPEKYDVVNRTHKVYAEYGNVGTDFDYITTSGFGWMNASFQLGLSLLPQQLVEALHELVPPAELF